MDKSKPGQPVDEKLFIYGLLAIMVIVAVIGIAQNWNGTTAAAAFALGAIIFAAVLTSLPPEEGE